MQVTSQPNIPSCPLHGCYRAERRPAEPGCFPPTAAWLRSPTGIGDHFRFCLLSYRRRRALLSARLIDFPHTGSDPPRTPVPLWQTRGCRLAILVWLTPRGQNVRSDAGRISTPRAGRPRRSNTSLFQSQAGALIRCRSGPQLDDGCCAPEARPAFPLRALSARGRPCRGRPAGAVARPGCARSLTPLPARTRWQRRGKGSSGGRRVGGRPGSGLPEEPVVGV
jgi:hypothetical protein